MMSLFRIQREKIFFGVLFMILACGAMAQENILNDKEFFITQGRSYEHWLKQIGLSPRISFSSVEVMKKKVKLKLSVPDSVQWAETEAYLLEEGGVSLSQLLMSKFRFLMELKPDQALIVVEAKGHKIFLDYSELRDDQPDPVLETKILRTQGGVEDVAKIPLGEVKRLWDGKGEKEILAAARVIRDSLKHGLENYFKTWFSGSGEMMEVISDYENVLCIEFRNLKGAILDQNYWERVYIEMFFGQDGDQLRVMFRIEAKFSAGIGFSPRDSRYKDIDDVAEYEGQMKKFREKVKTSIYKILGD